MDNRRLLGTRSIVPIKFNRTIDRLRLQSRSTWSTCAIGSEFGALQERSVADIAPPRERCQVSRCYQDRGTAAMDINLGGQDVSDSLIRTTFETHWASECWSKYEKPGNILASISFVLCMAFLAFIKHLNIIVWYSCWHGRVCCVPEMNGLRSPLGLSCHGWEVFEVVWQTSFSWNTRQIYVYHIGIDG